MSVLLRAQNLSKSYGIQTLFDDFNLGIEEGQKIGLIGPNGAGKSTLLKILANLESPDSGEVVARKGLNLVYIPQMAAFDPEHTVTQVLNQATQTMPEAQRAAAVAVTLGKLGFENPDQKVGALSGGWHKRLTLGCGLAQEPDLLLLDEPTNHLDTIGVWWLEDYLKTAPFTWLMVSHDRAFINRTVASVAELNAIFEDGIFSSKGNYQTFCQQRDAHLDAMMRYHDSLQNKVRRETEWLRAGVKARTTKAKYRIDAAHAMIEELDALKRRRDHKTAGIRFSSSERKTKKLMEVQNLAVSISGKTLFANLDHVFTPGSRTGILGTNGTGKTTLLRLLTKQRLPDQGTVRHAPDLKCVYFDQDRSQLNPEQSVKDALSPTGTDAVIYRGESVHIMSWASRFKFRPDQVRMTVGQLSGGEQARLLIARLMLEKADVLILDEPTNDLDIPTLEVLEESLLEFPGALILVTHDRFMLSRVCTQFLAFDGGGDLFKCADVAQWERGQKQTKTTKKAPSKSQPKKKTAKKLSYMEQRELESIEETIMEAEEHLEACQKAAHDPTIASDGAKLTEAYAALEKAEKAVSTLYDRWSELSAKQEALNQA